MAKPPFEFHAVSAIWGAHLPDGDYTVGRYADPRAAGEQHRKDHQSDSAPDSSPDELTERHPQADKTAPVK